MRQEPGHAPIRSTDRSWSGEPKLSQLVLGCVILEHRRKPTKRMSGEAPGIAA